MKYRKILFPIAALMVAFSLFVWLKPKAVTSTPRAAITNIVKVSNPHAILATLNWADSLVYLRGNNLPVEPYILLIRQVFGDDSNWVVRRHSA